MPRRSPAQLLPGSSSCAFHVCGDAHGARLRPATSVSASTAPRQRRDGLQLDPARGDVDRAQGMQEEAAAVLATMRDEIDLEKAWPGVVPLGEGAEGDLLLEPSARLRRAPTTAERQPPRGGQQTFQGRGADLAHL